MNNKTIFTKHLELKLRTGMLRLFAMAGFLFIGLCLLSSLKYHDSSLKGLKIILIRHGEKPDKGNNLSCSGFNRSLKLPELIRAKFGIPDYIFVPTPGAGKQLKNCRMLETITPFAIKYNLDINTTCDVNDIDKLTEKLKNCQGTVLVVWEHDGLPSIAKGLGVTEDRLNWKGSDYDGIWIITYKHGLAVLTKDKEDINPSSTCSF